MTPKNTGRAQYQTLSRLVRPVAFLATAFGSFARLKYPVFCDPDTVKAGILFGFWALVASALGFRAFRQPWLAMAGPIIGSWLIGIAVRNGRTVVLR